MIKFPREELVKLFEKRGRMKNLQQWEKIESNYLHLGLQPNALPVELTSHNGGRGNRTHSVLKPRDLQSRRTP